MEGRAIWSATGECFDIGRATRLALQRFRKTGEPYPGDADANAAGNGPLMKLAPVPMAYARRRPTPSATRSRARGRPTARREALDAARLLRAAAGRGAQRRRRTCCARRRRLELHPEVEAVAAGSYLDKAPPEIRGNGYVVLALEAALWAVASTDTYEAAILAAVNLGDDADTTAAIAGQLAGALYGVDAIPKRWRNKLVHARRDRGVRRSSV